MVVTDLVYVFDKYSKPDDDGLFLRTERFYKLPGWNPELYELLIKRYESHVDLIEDLTFEMTKAANYVCDKVRENLDGVFRIDQSVLLVRAGMDMNMTEHTYRLEYCDQERTQRPYRGLQELTIVRASHYGNA